MPNLKTKYSELLLTNETQNISETADKAGAFDFAVFSYAYSG